MKKQIALAVVIALSGAMGFAQDGAATYKANCQSCHGTAGTPNPGIAKMMGIKTAAEYNSDSEKVEIDAVTNGKGKMKAFTGKLTDAQIKDVVTYFRSLK
ncbi:MAG TPA: cytochrome c [Terracidiphilus sp.]|jgi:mono/diheme cytochrome c family protein|nr:cytochrome c [Terracidiphilus sp.]